MKKIRLAKGRKMRHEKIEKVLKSWLTPKQYELSHDWYYSFAQALAIEILLAAKKDGVDKLLLEESPKQTKRILQPGDKEFNLLGGIGKTFSGVNWNDVLSKQQVQVPYKSKVKLEEDTTSLEELKSVPLIKVKESLICDP
jgi:hypothetical protein